MKRERLLMGVFTAVLTAVAVTITVYVLHIPVGTGSGYIHLGDAVLFVAAALLPLPQALFVAVVGGGLSDVLSGAAIWVLPTVIIKSLMILPFSRRGEKMLTRRNAIASVGSVFISVVGYTVAGWMVYGSFAAGLADVIPNVLQGVGSAVLFYALAAALDRMEWKRRFFPSSL